MQNSSASKWNNKDMSNQPELDALEVAEWEQAFNDVLQHSGPEVARQLLSKLSDLAAKSGIERPFSINTPYCNSISERDEPPYPGEIYLERELRSAIRWNAMAMVMRANRQDSSIGGHISTFMSITTLQEVGFNHFFHAPSADSLGDLVFFQGHSAPGVYARSFLEGRLEEQDLNHFRKETREHPGLSSYPHPWLMPDYWQFPTVSMGLGPMQAIYQAHVRRYLHNRGLIDEAGRKVWCFVGDGETDEPETLGSIALAGREKLDNLVFVVNCNLQRLDGPVRGNGKIIQELEGVFRGAGWNVIKVIWGKYWDNLFQRDSNGLLQKLMDKTVDGEYQNFKNKGGAYTREHLFGKHPELLQMVANMSDDDIARLNRGGHDVNKVYAAYNRAWHHSGQPTVILAKTIKGYGTPAEAENIAHSVKKYDLDGLKRFRDRFEIPIADEQLPDLPYYKPAADSPAMRYMQERRQQLGGYLPQRSDQFTALPAPKLELFKNLLDGSKDREISTTMAFVRALTALTKDKSIGERIVPIVPDEARTFGMEGMFRSLSIYTSDGQKYVPQDSESVMYYRESKQGQILQEGINEAGAMSAWIAAATSAVNNNCPLVPFYIFYSMFGFQRVGDFAWAAGDQRARGFLIGATAGRTTLAGEGLQHGDGHSHVFASVIPNCIAYDPAYAYELAVIIQDGMRRMYQQQESVYYYVTVSNENYPQPALPEGAQEGILRGMYQVQTAQKPRVRLLGSGPILRETLAASALLRERFDIASSVFSVTSYTELNRDAAAKERAALMQGQASPEASHIQSCLGASSAPVIAASDYIRAHSEQVRRFIKAPYYTLGTDGFGRSDTRSALRSFFEIDAAHIAYCALYALMQSGSISAQQLVEARAQLGVDANKNNPMHL